MQGKKIEILPAAYRDIDGISDYYTRMAGPGYAENITNELLDNISLLSEFPMAGAIHPDPVLAKMEYRKILCREYVCIYRIIDDTIFIYRVIHGSTDYPKYFK